MSWPKHISDEEFSRKEHGHMKSEREGWNFRNTLFSERVKKNVTSSGDKEGKRDRGIQLVT